MTPTDRRMARPQDTALARFYGLPKVHKDGAPLRPIVSLKGTPTYGLAKWLFRRLKFLTAGSDTMVSSSAQFLEKLKGLGSVLRPQPGNHLDRQAKPDEGVRVRISIHGTSAPPLLLHPSPHPPPPFSTPPSLLLCPFLPHPPPLFSFPSPVQPHPSRLPSNSHLPPSPPSFLCPFFSTLLLLPFSFPSSDPSFPSLFSFLSSLPITYSTLFPTIEESCSEGDMQSLRKRIGLVGHLRTQRTNRQPITVVAFSTAPASNSTKTTSAPTPTNAASNPRSALLSATTTSIASATTTAATTNTATSATTTNDQNAPNAPKTTNAFSIITPASSDVDSVPTCPFCGRTFISHIGLVGHLRIHWPETRKPVPGAPIHFKRHRFHYSNWPRTLSHLTGLSRLSCAGSTPSVPPSDLPTST
ncbi:hypothetical protein SprV_0401610300 [Sparganum proliferum]